MLSLLNLTHKAQIQIKTEAKNNTTKNNNNSTKNNNNKNSKGSI